MNEEHNGTPNIPPLDFGALLQRVKSDPQMLTGLLSMLTADAPPKTSPEEPPVSISRELPQNIPAFVKPKSQKRELLCALKPFLSTKKCEGIDRILHMYELLDLMKQYR